LVDARLSHTANGVYGEMWSAALVSAALTATSAAEAFDRALEVVPVRSRLRSALGHVRALREQEVDAVAALDWVDSALGRYPWVHTINNAALIAIGLLWGDDLLHALTLTVGGGRDTDSNGATVGSVWGALHGEGAMPEVLRRRTSPRVRSAIRDFDRIPLDDLVARTLRLLPVSGRGASSAEAVR
jgi:ADP-ribosylglycohydrolase